MNLSVKMTDGGKANAPTVIIITRAQTPKLKQPSHTPGSEIQLYLKGFCSRRDGGILNTHS